jgi:hypothetical protein
VDLARQRNGRRHDDDHHHLLGLFELRLGLRQRRLVQLDLEHLVGVLVELPELGRKLVGEQL